MVKRGPKGGQLQLLSKDEVRSIHNAALDVLERTGMESYSGPILDIFDEAGAEVDRDAKRIKIPEYLIVEGLRKAPSKITFCGRNPENDILLEGDRVYYGFGGTPTPLILDRKTEEYRRPTKKDMAEATLLGNGLPNIDFMMTNAGVFDVPFEAEYLHEFEVLLNYSEKPILYSAPSAFEASKFLEMGSAVAGSAQELRRRPIFALYSETASPLMFTEANENMIEFARAGIPIALGPMPLSGATAPMTLAGTSLIGTSENLAAIALIQLANPHAPVIYGGWGLAMDPRTGACAYGSPEFALGANAINAQMARFYGLPRYGFGGCSDAKLPSAQSGAEVMMNALIAAQSGVNLIHDCGYLSGGMVGSMEEAVVCNEILGMVKRIIRGAIIDDEHLAVDVIHEVGPGRDFTTHKHTMRHVNEFLLSGIFDRNSLETWKNRGGKDTRTFAREYMEKILTEHKPEPLPDDVKRKLSEIVKEGEAKLVKR